jgi:copper resistance protein C
VSRASGLRAIRAAWAGGLAAALALLPSAVGSHTFVARSEPRAGETIGEPPSRIRIWFDGPVEPMFLDIRVESGEKRRVDRADAHLDPRDNALVEVGLGPVSPGRYRVFWSVIARDGHRRDGSFSFLYK